jgi:hypothetical protein
MQFLRQMLRKQAITCINSVRGIVFLFFDAYVFFVLFNIYLFNYIKIQ